jgi:murein DD-endopeptidase MepM/ murein hydrolase activator NlpD
MVAKWRDIFPRFVNDTFFELAEQGSFDMIEEDNEYLANSHTTIEIDARVTNAQAALAVWNNEYRAQHDALKNIRLVLCNTAIGNWIDRRFAKAAIEEDGILAYHPYTHWSTYSGEPQRAANDWSDLSGLWDRMEKSWGLKPYWAFTEAGPFESALDGWKSPNCLNNRVDLYLLAIREWLEDVQETSAYIEGRIFGFNLFTTGGSSEWKYYETKQPELNTLADLVSEMWKPGTTPPPPEPPQDECKGLPRVQYKRIVNVIPANTPAREAAQIFESLWAQNPTTVGPSYDDAGIGDLGNKKAVLYNLPTSEHSRYATWYAEEYPGTVVEFKSASFDGITLTHPVKDVPFSINHPFNQPRDYNEDGIYNDLHEGLDLLSVKSDGSPAIIVAAASGVVERVRTDYTIGKGYGIYVRLDHGNGWKTWYCHLGSASVSEGQAVSRGAELGVSDSTGNSTGTHLHFNLQKIGDGLPGYVLPDIIDPTPYFNNA